jgi:2-C-methyl-D-erythritol 4-phosphate cytidylyltransferase
MSYSNDDLMIAEGDSKNFKITKSADLEMAEFILNNNLIKFKRGGFYDQKLRA